MSSVANGPQGLQHYIANSTSNAHKKACAVSCRICSLATGSQGLGRWIALSTYKTQGEGRRSLMQNMLSGDRATRSAALECKFYIHDTQKACATSCRIFSKATGPQGPRHQISIFTNNTHTHTHTHAEPVQARVEYFLQRLDDTYRRPMLSHVGYVL
jgi:hypothetical protein